MEKLSLKTVTPQQLCDITAEVRQLVSESGVQEGLCLVYTPHSTAGVVIACGIDPHALVDVDRLMRRLVPIDSPFAHTCDPATDAAGHLKSILANAQQIFPVSQGKLMLGSSQGIYFFEFDGPRERTVYVQIIGA
ncbi:MAG: YjbQ family protein [Oscillospiraceae bacterium]|nr:YjbQ family protein [Oscillospiraceae bacterium]